MKTKLSLEKLQINSFVTLGSKHINTVRGGHKSLNPGICNNFVTAGVETEIESSRCFVALNDTNSGCIANTSDNLPTLNTCNIECLV